MHEFAHAQSTVRHMPLFLHYSLISTRDSPSWNKPSKSIGQPWRLSTGKYDPPTHFTHLVELVKIKILLVHNRNFQIGSLYHYTSMITPVLASESQTIKLRQSGTPTSWLGIKPSRNIATSCYKSESRTLTCSSQKRAIASKKFNFTLERAYKTVKIIQEYKHVDSPPNESNPESRE